jgi:hypothetical protein
MIPDVRCRVRSLLTAGAVAATMADRPRGAPALATRSFLCRFAGFEGAVYLVERAQTWRTFRLFDAIECFGADAGAAGQLDL